MADKSAKDLREAGMAGRNSAIPAYHRLGILLIEGIKNGRYPPGSLLPSENALTQQYGVSRVTVRRALAQLVEQGVVTKHHGHGTLVKVDAFVNERQQRLSGLMSALVGGNADFTTRTLDHNTISPSNPVSVKLGLPAGTQCMLIRRVRDMQGRPISYASIYLPLEIAERIEGREDEDLPVLEMLEATDRKPVRTEFTLGAGLAEGQIAEQLHLPIGSPVLQMRSVAFDDADRPIYYQESVYDPDRYEYSGKMRRGMGEDGVPCWIPSE